MMVGVNIRDVIYVPEAIGKPDGLCVDKEGLLWIALWGGGSVIRVNPVNGQIVSQINLPASKTSCPCFAGERLDELVVTSASEGIDMDKEPLAGCLFVIKVGIPGREPYRYG